MNRVGRLLGISAVIEEAIEGALRDISTTNLRAAAEVVPLNEIRFNITEMARYELYLRRRKDGQEQ